MKKKFISALIIISSITTIGCQSNSNNETTLQSNIEEQQEIVDWWSKSEEYNVAKEYSKGDIVKFEGEVGRMYWYRGSSNSYYINGCKIKWEESKDFNMGSICNNMYFGGIIRIVGECYGTNSFFIKDCVIVEPYKVDLNLYIEERAKLDKEGISESEAITLYKWCKENEEVMRFEKALEPNIFDLYHDTLQSWEN